MDSSIPCRNRHGKINNQKQKKSLKILLNVKQIKPKWFVGKNDTLCHLKESLASVQQDFVEKFHILFLHQFVWVNPGALVQPQVDQVYWVADALRQSEQNSLHTKVH